jgi:acetoin utilization deacetylase AcuC-like enzyme
VLIVDWDVHHGNGTQQIFWDDPGVLYVSTHQSPLYPGTGRAGEVGGPNALGMTINVPLPAGATGDVVREAIAEIAAPTIDAFAPDWVLVSCGFDGHRADPLANFALSSGDFAQLAADVSQFVPRPGRLAVFLEGGYDPSALRRCVASTVSSLLDRASGSPSGVATGPEDATFGGPGVDHVRLAIELRRRAIARVADGSPADGGT